MIGPTPLALTMDQMKNAMPAMGTTIALAVKRWRLQGCKGEWVLYTNGLKGTYILWMGNQMAGREISQKRKKHMKSRVDIPADSGKLFATRDHK